MSSFRSFRFIIPLNIEDLTQSCGQFDVYCVQIEYNSRDLSTKLNDCVDNYKEKGIHFILEDFDVFYSCLKNFDSLEAKHRDQSWKLIYKCLNRLLTDLERVLNTERSDGNERTVFSNLLKMIVYVFSSLSELFEERVIKEAQSIDLNNAGPKGQKKTKRSEESYDWQQNKDKGMSALLRLLSLPLNRLFNPPVVEDEFINVITKVCYKMLENSSLKKDSNLAQTIYHIIGSAVEKHRQSLSFCLKLIQLLQHKEQLVSILAHLVETIVKKHNQKILISEIIREIRRIDINELSHDSSGPRSISKFIEELSDKCPQEMLSSISDLLEFLEEDSYLMRNAILTTIGNIVIKQLSQTEGSKERLIRDQLLDKLEDHIHDNTGWTRSRALHVWSTLCQAEVIPLPRLESLIDAVIGRLQDKTCFVRKNAIQFLTQFLIKNPFAAKLPVHLLKGYHQKEVEKLKALMDLQKDNELKNNRVGSAEDLDQLNDIWNSIESELLQFWTQIESTSESCDEESDDVLNHTILSNFEDIEEVFHRFRSLIKEKRFKSCLSLLKQMRDQFPNNEVIHPVIREEMDIEDNDDLTVEDEDMGSDFEDKDNNAKPKGPPLPDTISLAKRIFFANSKTSENISLDLGSKAVERDIEKIATHLIQSSQGSTEQSRPMTTTIEVARLSTSDEFVNDISRQQILVKYLSDCIKFTEQIQIAIPLVSDLLLSRNATDVLEAIEFFVSAYKFGVKDALIGVRKLILLIWSSEPNIKSRAVEAYKKIYLVSESEERLSDSSEKVKAYSVIKSLSELVIGATLGELISIEQFLMELMGTDILTATHIQVLWERFAMKLPNTTPDESRAAIQLIGMLATSKPELIRTDKNLNAIITEGLGERGRNDSRLVSETCIALGKAYRLPKTENFEMFFRLPKTHDLFVNLRSLLTNGLGDINDNYYDLMADNVVKVIYQLAEHPDAICELLVKEMLQKLLSLTQTEEQTIEMQSNGNEDKENSEQTPQQTEEPIDMDSQSTQTSQPIEMDRQSTQSSQMTERTNEQLVSQTLESIRNINPEILSRFISLIGNIALNVLIHIDLNVLTELKIRNYIKEEKDKKNKTPRRKSRTTGKTPTTVAGDQNLEEEIGLAGANAVEDQEQEYLNNICSTDIVFGQNLLARLSELVVSIAQDPIAYPDVKLLTAASLTLAKYMSVSENFCRLHLRLLFTIMDKSEEAVIRANTIIALGDLCVRFPNLLDQWSPKMFQRLRDPDVGVKMNTLKVLSRLIISDMVKVKGQISEIAVLMVDDNEMIASASRLFFTELGKKQNAIYNVLPDIISHLSEPETRLPEEDFQTVMKFIFDLIDKSRQTICLVEKLCQRFRTTTDERQWRDLAFCLSSLDYNEKSFQKLHENLICFADKLCFDLVYDCIQRIIANIRKVQNNRSEFKQMVEEFDNKVKECKQKGLNEDNPEFQAVVGTPQSAAKRMSRHTSANKRQPNSSTKKLRQKPQNKTKRKVVSKGSEEEDTDEEIVSNKRIVSNLRSERPQRNVRKLQTIQSSSESDSS